MFHSTGVINFYILYLLGRWLYKTGIIYQLTINSTQKYWFITSVIFILTYSIFIKCNFDAEKMQSLFIGFNYAAPLVILQAVFLFISFGNMTIQSKFINWCSTFCLSIFLIHMYPAIKNIGYYSYIYNLYNKPLCKHIIILLILMIIAFVGSILVDKIRIFISDKIYSILLFIHNKIPH